ncbi:hypothetical protein C8R45DRAFT_938246 [Mycena sanguinolenta]|nr:hypothetical protein C8R45DRAFT_938246 [Mycena sanguinolenta]
MPFAKSSTSPPQTVKSLARMHVKVPDSTHHNHGLVAWFQPRKVPRPAVGYRRVMQTSPPASLPTLRHLSIGRRHSTPSSVPQHSPAPAEAGPSVHESKGPHLASAGAPAAISSSSKKPYLYESHRIASGSPRCATNHPSGQTEPVSSSPQPTTVVPRRRGARPMDAGSPGETRRHGVPVFPDDLQVILKDVLRLKDREEQEEKLLTELLSGRVVGGEGIYGRVKMVPASERVDSSADWMATLF